MLTTRVQCLEMCGPFSSKTICKWIMFSKIKGMQAEVAVHINDLLFSHIQSLSGDIQRIKHASVHICCLKLKLHELKTDK